MPGVVTPATFTSLVRYGQMLGLIFGLGSEDELGVKLGSFAQGLSNFFNRVFEYIPYFPDLDVRVRFVVLSWLLPSIFTLIFLWFTRSAVANLLTIVMFVSNFCFFYEVAFASYSDSAEVGTYLLIPLAIIGWAGVIAYEVVQYRKHRGVTGDDIESIMDGVITYFVDGVIPNRHNDGRTMEDIDGTLDARRESLITHPATPTIYNLGVCGILFIGCIFLLLYSTGPIVSEKDRVNIVVEWFLNVIVILLMLMIIAVAVMILVPAAQDFFVTFRVTIRRLLLKILLIVLDCLYIPICQAMIDLCFIGSWHCDPGEYLNWDHVGGEGFWNSLYDRNVTCDPCIGNWSESVAAICDVRCNGGLYELHNNISEHLLFNRDVMGMTGPLMVYAVLAVVIGQPIWWAFLISGNKDIAWAFPCYGETAEKKWAWLSEKLLSPGVFLFYQYKHTRTFWGWVLPITKIVCVVLAQIIEYTDPKVSWALLFWYVAIVVLNVKYMPYRFKFNNIFDIATSASNVLLTILALVTAYHPNFPKAIVMPITIILVVLPLLAIVYGFVRKSDEVEQLGVIQAYDEEGNATESIVSEWSVEKDLYWLLSIWNAEEHEDEIMHRDGELVESVVPNSELITITSEFVNGKLFECQQKLDSICDAYSTHQVVSVLRITCALSCACAGWFFGGVAGTRLVSQDIDC